MNEELGFTDERLGEKLAKEGLRGERSVAAGFAVADIEDIVGGALVCGRLRMRDAMCSGPRGFTGWLDSVRACMSSDIFGGSDALLSCARGDLVIASPFNFPGVAAREFLLVLVAESELWSSHSSSSSESASSNPTVFFFSFFPLTTGLLSGCAFLRILEVLRLRAGVERFFFIELFVALPVSETTEPFQRTCGPPVRGLVEGEAGADFLRW